MKHTFTDPDLIELDRTWPIGQMLEVPEQGTIVVAGAYEGRYLHYFSERFSMAHLFGFEPQSNAFAVAQRRLGSKACLFNYGLGTATRDGLIGNSDSDGCSFYVSDGVLEYVTMKDAVTVLLEIVRNPIDLLLLNCEGSEWALLPYLLDEMMHHRIASIALQQHTKYASKEHIARVKSYLAEYYDLIYTDGQLDGWEYWRRK